MSDDEYEALEILGKRAVKKRIQYLVKWADGPNGQKYEPSWEPEDFVGLPLIQEFEAKVLPPAGRQHAVNVPAARPPAAADLPLALSKPRRGSASTVSSALLASAPPETASAAPPETAPPETAPAAPPETAPVPRIQQLSKQGLDPSVRFGTISGLPSSDCVEAELQVFASTIDDHGTGISVQNGDQVYVIGYACCQSSTKAFYRIATCDKCVGFILSQFVQLHA